MRHPVLSLVALAALLLSGSGVVEASCMGAAAPSAPAPAAEAHAHHAAGAPGAGHGHGAEAPAPQPRGDEGGRRLPVDADCPYAPGSAGSCLGGFVAAAAARPADDRPSAPPFPAPEPARDLLIAASLERPPRA